MARALGLIVSSGGAADWGDADEAARTRHESKTILQ